MSDDLVKRLRIVAEATGPNEAQQIALKAADRIEELEAETKRLETENSLQAKEIDKTRRRADKLQSMVLDCEKYLKPRETPAERIQREIDDCLGMMKLLEKKQTRIEELEAKLAEYKHVSSAIDTQWAESQDEIAVLKAGLAKAEWMLVEATVQLREGKAKTRRNRADLIDIFLAELKNTPPADS